MEILGGLCNTQCNDDFAIFSQTYSLTLVILNFCVPSFCNLNTFVKVVFNSYINTQDSKYRLNVDSSQIFKIL